MLRRMQGDERQREPRRAGDAAAPAAVPGSSRWETLGLPGVLVLLSLPLIFYGLGRYSVVNGDEAIYHGIARHMVASGDWTRLFFGPEERLYDTFTHAPLYLWLKALVILAVGDGMLAMRLPSACFGVATPIALYFVVRRLAGARAALLAGLVQLTTFQVIYLHGARTGEMETALAFFLLGSAALFLRALERDRGFVGHHLCTVALANLKLGFAAIPVLAVGLAFALHPSLRRRILGWARTGVWVLPLGLLWHVYQVSVRFDALPEVFEALGRQTGATGGPSAVGRVLHHLWYYAVQAMAGTWPWVFVQPLALAVVLRGRRGPARRPWAVLALYAAAVWIYFLALPIHRPWYMVPALPFLAAFVGAWLDGLLRAAPGRWAIAGLAAALTLVLLTQVPIAGFDPFVERAVVAWPVPRLRRLPGLDSPLGALALALALAAAAFALARRAPPPLLGALVLLALLGPAALRVVAPLDKVERTSEMEALRARLDERLRRGEPLPRRLELAEPGVHRATFYFAKEYEVRDVARSRGREGVKIVLRLRDAAAPRPD